MSDSLLLRLIEIINAEIRSFHRLLELLKAEQAAIVEDDIEGIEACVEQQQEVATQTQMLEAERLKIVEEISLDLNMEAENVSLNRLISVVEGDRGEELARMRGVLLELNDSIRQANENNAFLIRQSMRYSDRCLDILTGQPVGQNMYGQFGKMRKRNYGTTVLNRTV